MGCRRETNLQVVEKKPDVGSVAINRNQTWSAWRCQMASNSDHRHAPCAAMFTPHYACAKPGVCNGFFLTWRQTTRVISLYGRVGILTAEQLCCLICRLLKVQKIYLYFFFLSFNYSVHSFISSLINFFSSFCYSSSSSFSTYSFVLRSNNFI